MLLAACGGEAGGEGAVEPPPDESGEATATEAVATDRIATGEAGETETFEAGENDEAVVAESVTPVGLRLVLAHAEPLLGSEQRALTQLVQRLGRARTVVRSVATEEEVDAIERGTLPASWATSERVVALRVPANTQDGRGRRYSAGVTAVVVAQPDRIRFRAILEHNAAWSLGSLDWLPDVVDP